MKKMKKISGWKLVLFLLAYLAAAFVIAWMISQTGWLRHLNLWFWLCTYIVQMIFWTLSIINTRRNKRDQESSRAFRSILSILGIITVISYIFQLARLFYLS